MIKEIINILSYEYYKNDNYNYFNDKIIPSVISDILNSDDNEISSDSFVRCSKNRNDLQEKIKKNGYNTSIEEVLKYYPIFVSNKLDLLGEYISNTLLCKFLEEGKNSNELIIKLDGNSNNTDLNFFGSQFKKLYDLKYIILVYDYDKFKEINFLKLKYIYHTINNTIILPTDFNWIEYVSSGYFELLTILTLEHALWHLITSHITCVVKENNINRELVKVFTMSEDNIFTKAIEIKKLFFESPLLFNTILYDDPIFIKYITKWINEFIYFYDIDSYFNNKILRKLNPLQQWIPGFKENLNLIKEFSKSIIEKTDKNDYYSHIWSWKYNKNVDRYDKIIEVQKLIQLNYTIGYILHSTTFEYEKIFFTEIIYNKKMSSKTYFILLSTLNFNNDDPLFGDYKYYDDNKYKESFEELSKNLEKIRNKISQQIKKNTIFQSYTFTDLSNIISHHNMNTWNTFI